VDASPEMLERARQLLGPSSVLLLRTMPALNVEGPFDAAVSTFDALNYLAPNDLRSTLVAVAGQLRPGGSLVFDVHTDAMMRFTAEHPVVSGETNGITFEIRSIVDLDARTCETRIDVSGTSDGDGFTEVHRQYFHSDEDLTASLTDAGFALVGHSEEYTDRPVDRSTLRATWAARSLP
jgi:hypothetical protein